MSKDFIPQTDGDLVKWLNNYKDKIVSRGPGLGLSAGQIGARGSAIGNFLTQFNAYQAAQSALAAQSIALRETQKALLTSMRAEIRGLKAHANMTPAITADLEIAGEVSSFDPDTYQAKIKEVKVFPGKVTLVWEKGPLDSMNIYGRLKGQTEWKFVARDTNSPYDDYTALATPGQAEVREYRARGLIRDVEIGQPSDVKTVTYAG